MTAVAALRPLRVALYTRKSVTDGLDRAFSSLDAQRQAIENYVASQAGLGWVALAKRYDDGGFTGANIDRPAFQELLRDINAGQVDIVAVYKIDRLSRSLLDFATLMDTFEKRHVTFVSVTQQFSTASSIGKLTLNILMSFAEFERDVIGERIRDKVRATRRRGAWTGGRPVLGYDVIDKKLVVNADEALQVRETFRLYLERGSLRETVAELRRRGWRNKTFTTTKAKTAEGGPFGNTTLYTMLTNDLYRGQMRCGSELVPSEHEAIVDAETWDAVQQQLRTNGHRGGSAARNKTNALLRGLLRCARCGSVMTHTFSTRNGRRTRYYVCTKLHTEGPPACPGSRVPAGKFEAFVIDQIKAIGSDKALLAKTAESVAAAAAERAQQLDGELRRGELERRRLETTRSDLLRAAPPSAAAAAPLLEQAAVIDVQLRALAERHATVRAERESLTGNTMQADLRDALASFTPIWEHLFPAERERVMRLLIEQVTYNPDGGDADIHLRACGITTLAQEARSTK